MLDFNLGAVDMISLGKALEESPLIFCQETPKILLILSVWALSHHKLVLWLWSLIEIEIRLKLGGVEDSMGCQKFTALFIGILTKFITSEEAWRHLIVFHEVFCLLNLLKLCKTFQ